MFLYIILLVSSTDSNKLKNSFMCVCVYIYTYIYFFKDLCICFCVSNPKYLVPSRAQHSVLRVVYIHVLLIIYDTNKQNKTFSLISYGLSLNTVWGLLRISVKLTTFYFLGAKYLNDWLAFTDLLSNEDIYNVRLDIFRKHLHQYNSLSMWHFLSRHLGAWSPDNQKYGVTRDNLWHTQHLGKCGCSIGICWTHLLHDKSQFFRCSSMRGHGKGSEN